MARPTKESRLRKLLAETSSSEFWRVLKRCHKRFRRYRKKLTSVEKLSGGDPVSENLRNYLVPKFNALAQGWLEAFNEMNDKLVEIHDLIKALGLRLPLKRALLLNLRSKFKADPDDAMEMMARSLDELVDKAGRRERKTRVYSEEMMLFVAEWEPKHSWKEITKKCIEKFHKNFTPQNLEKAFRRWQKKKGYKKI